jgi:hypothetical protein
MLTTELGLTLDAYSWPLYAGLAALWLWSLRLVPDRARLGWHAVPMSIFGFTWLGFGLIFILRFPFLCWDSFTFGNMTSRLADATSGQVNFSLFLLGLYWACLAGAYFVGRRRLSAGPIHRLGVLSQDRSGRPEMFLALCSTVGIVLSSGRISVPLALLTPLGIVGALWVLPAALVLWEEFRYGSRSLFKMGWLYLLPGLLRVILSPYREILVEIVAVVFIAALFAGKRFRLTSVVLSILVFFMAITVVITAYRQVLWEHSGIDEIVDYTERGYTWEKSYDAQWVRTLSRFHGFDSLLLTTRYVPEVFPFSGRNLVVDSLLRGVVPRAFYAGKEGSVRGTEFASTIWGYGEEKISNAAIAPTMPADLFEAGGIAAVVYGGLVWGLLIGLLEGWKMRLSAKGAAATTAVFALQCASSTQRDFAHVVSTVIQFLIVIYLITKLLSRSAAPVRASSPAESAAV